MMAPFGRTRPLDTPRQCAHKLALGFATAMTEVLRGSVLVVQFR
jgi:hypothetical protein